jgi:uncharacterized protein with von Willebrand factor type A (vWA) domain
MFLNFFYLLKQREIPVSTREYLHLLEAVQEGLHNYNIDEFYTLCKVVLIKHEQYYDRFDIAFSEFFKGIKSNTPTTNIEQISPEQFSIKNDLLSLSEVDINRLSELLSAEELMRLAEQFNNNEAQQFKATLENKGIRLNVNGKGNQGLKGEGGSGGGKTSINAWDSREYKNLDMNRRLNNRNIKLALKHLRLWAREGVPEELDLKNTIHQTAAQGGLLNVEMMPSQKNHVKVLLFFDVGGSMGPFVDACSELFSAAHAEFKHLEYYYFHNCIYHQVWKDNRRRFGQETPTLDILHKFNSSYKVIFVGDANMSPSEYLDPVGTYNSKNKDSGEEWMKRITSHFKHCVWLNPLDVEYWGHSQSVLLLQRSLNNRMYPLTIAGIKDAMKRLMH